VKKEKAGYYEKKLARYEKELEGLKQCQRQQKEVSQEVAKILISPFVLNRLIREKERENRKLLKQKAQRNDRDERKDELSSV
jgi:hypothetical protein